MTPEELRKALDDIGYTKVFWAIANSVEILSPDSMSISVEALIKALTGIDNPRYKDETVDK